MKVSIRKITQDPLMTIIEAARRCYSAEELPSFDPNKSKEDFIRFLKDRKHLTPFEFVDVIFSINDISRACSLQLVRHRIASYAQQSQRYCKGYPGYIIPEAVWKKLESGNIRVQNALIKFFDAFNDLTATLTDEKISQEDQRYFWVEGTKTQIYVKFNLRSLFNFFELRLDPHAQWEIRQMAGLMYEKVSNIIPEVFPKLSLS